MGRHIHEFQCNGGTKDMAPRTGPTNGSNCGWFNYPPLRDDMTGNYTIVCGNPDCRHEHYRTIVKGVITEDRHNTKYGTAERLVLLKSQCSPTKRVLGSVAQFRQMEAAGLAFGPPDRE